MSERLIRQQWLILLAIIVGGLALRLSVSGHSLWEDEFFSVYWVKQGLAYIWGQGLKIESNPPLYYTILFFWTKLFSFGEIALRLPSILASVATIPVVYQIGTRVFENRTALIAASLFAIMPVDIAWAEQARSYGLQILLGALCLLAIIDLFSDDITARRKALVLYFISATLLAWTHYVQVYFIAACGIVVLIACQRQRHPALAKSWVLANAAILLATFAEIPLMLAIATHTGLLMIRVPFADIPGNIAIMMAGTSFPMLATFISGAILYGAYCIWIQKNFKTRVILIEIPALYVFLLSAANFFHPAFIARALVALAIPSALILAKLITGIHKQTLQMAALAMLVGIYGFSMKRDFHATPFREVFAHLAARYRSGDAIVFGPFDRIGALGYYQPELMNHDIFRWRPLDWLPVTPEDHFWNNIFHPNVIDAAAFQALIAQHRRVWLILLEDNAMLSVYKKQLIPAPVVFADDKLLHVYLWQGRGIAP